MSILSTARQGFKSVTRGGGGGFAGWYGSYGGADGFDWNQEAGIRYDNSIVFALIMCAINALTEVDILVERPGPDGKYVEVPGHPITQLLNYPNPWYDLTTLMGGWIISEIAGRGGMSYTYKHRSAGGKLIGLEYLPHFSIKPYTSPGSMNFIDSFKLSVQGGMADVDPKNILQQRYGPINPRFPQVSIGPLEAVLQEICTDNQAANYTASLLKNVGVTPHLISPNIKSDDVEIEFSEAQVAQIESVWSEKITGSNRGRPLIMPIPVNVDSLSFNPSDMNLGAIHDLSEERICAVMGIPPLCVHLGTGLDSSNNRASAEAAARALARGFTKPYMAKKASQLTRDLVPELGQPGDRVRFRTEAIEGLQDDKTEMAKRDEIEVGGPYVTVNEKRLQRGLMPIDGGDVLREKRSKAPADPEKDDATITD